MKIQHGIRFGAIVLVLVFAAPVFAQRPRSTPPPQAPAPPLDLDNGQAPPTDTTPREIGEPMGNPGGQMTDPLVPGPRLRGVLQRPTQTNETGPNSAVPHLVGRVIAKGKPPLALIELNKEMYVVTKGSIIRGYKVVDLSGSMILLESLQHSGERMNLR